MSISAAQVKELRDLTGAGMMDYKAALAETTGDMEAAVDWLRKKGIAKADKKAGRTAAEGLIGVDAGVREAAVVEVNSEPDFVARNDAFQQIVANVSKVALAYGKTEAVANAKYPGSDKSVTDTIKDAVGTIGENLGFRRSDKLTVSQGAVATYIHNAVADNLGKLGVLVAIETAGDAHKASAFARQVAMHVAATNPQSLDIDALDPAAIEREKAIFSDQARASGKPENIIEKMVEGRLRKFYEEVVLLKQAFVLNPDVTVEQALKEAELDEVKKSVDELRSLNPAAEIRKQLNPFEQAAADVRAGVDDMMKPKPAPDPQTPASSEPQPADPLKNGATVLPGVDGPQAMPAQPVIAAAEAGTAWAKATRRKTEAVAAVAKPATKAPAKAAAKPAAAKATATKAASAKPVAAKAAAPATKSAAAKAPATKPAATKPAKTTTKSAAKAVTPAKPEASAPAKKTARTAK